MNLVYQSAFLKALGWALLDSLWQLGVLWLLYIWLTGNGKKFQSRQRHTLALLSLAGGFIWFLITLVIHFYKAAAAPVIVTVMEGSEPVAAKASSNMGLISSLIESALPLLSIGYLLMAMFLFIRLYRQYRSTRRLLGAGISKAAPEFRVFLQQVAAHIGIKKNVQIWLSSVVDAPLTLGFWKPVILLPIAAVNCLSIQQTEAIILHELQHIKRNDYLINLLIAVTDVILFFNPFAKLLADHIYKEREHSCDDMVLQFRYDAALYARSLLVLEQNRSNPVRTLAIAATGKSNQLLLHRVKRILYNEPVSSPVSQKFIAYLLSAVLIGFIGWSNPGKVIVRTISKVEKPATLVEYATTFETPGTPQAPTPPPAKPARAPKKPSGSRKAIEQTLFHEIQEALDQENEMKLAALKQQAEKVQQIQGYVMVSNKEARDYSMATGKTVSDPDLHGSAEVRPFVPSYSLAYQIVEDTTLPRRYVETYSEKKARESMEKTLKALQALDWQKLEKDLGGSGKKVDVVKLQRELQKAFKEINWNKVNEDVQGSFQVAEEEISKNQDAWRQKLEAYQHARAKKQADIGQLQQQIVEQRLMENRKAERKSNAGNCEESIRVAPANKPNTTTRPATRKAKRIVDI